MKGRLKGRHTDEVVGSPISLKHVYEIAKIKRGELRLSGLSEEGVVRWYVFVVSFWGSRGRFVGVGWMLMVYSVVAQAKTVGVVIKA